MRRRAVAKHDGRGLRQELALHRKLCELAIARGGDITVWQELLAKINALDRDAAVAGSLADSFSRHTLEPEQIVRARYREQQAYVLRALLREGLTPQAIRAKYGARDWTLQQIEALRSVEDQSQ